MAVNSSLKGDTKSCVKAVSVEQRLNTIVNTSSASSGTKQFNVKDYGAVGNGSHNDTTAIQAAIDATTGSAAPATNTRLPAGEVYLPPGTYLITADLIIRSVQGFRFRGAGPEMTFLAASGTGFTKAVILIDGSADGIFEGFTLLGNSTEQVTDGIRLDWTTAAHRSTSGNMFRDIRIRNLKCIVGISLESNGTRQLDGNSLQNIVVTGYQVAGSWTTSGNYQKGIAFGNGSFGNIYDQRLYGVDVAGFYYGYYCNASSFAMYSAQPEGNATDFFIIPGAQTTISNIQSQSSGRFLIQTSAFSPIPVSVKDIVFVSSHMDPSTNIVDIYGGMWTFDNFCAPYTQTGGGGAYVGATFKIRGAFPTRPGVVTLNNITLNNSLISGILPTATQAQIVVHNYSQFNTSTATYTITNQAIYTGSGWNYLGPPSTLIPTFSNGVAAQLSDVSHDYMLYFQIGTAGTAFSLKVGPTSGVTNTIMSGAIADSGQLITIRIPAGWFVKWAATTATLASQIAIGC